MDLFQQNDVNPLKTLRSYEGLIWDNTPLKLPGHFLPLEIKPDFNSATIVIYK